MTTVHLTPNQVPPILMAGYNGTKIKVNVCTTVHIPSDAGTWSGGSRDLYRGVRLSDGASVSLVNTTSAPWDATRGDREIALTNGLVVVKHTTFESRDLGLTIYMHPDNAAPMLPPKAALDPTWQAVLDIVRAYKSSYRRTEAAHKGISESAYDAAIAGLKGLGYLDTRGAITVAGKNAATARGY